MPPGRIALTESTCRGRVTKSAHPRGKPVLMKCQYFNNFPGKNTAIVFSVRCLSTVGPVHPEDGAGGATVAAIDFLSLPPRSPTGWIRNKVKRV